MSVHRIRLAGPWEYTWLESLDHKHPEQASGTIKIPADWQVVFGLVAGSAVFSRKFHRPTNLEPHEQVVMHFKGIAGSGEIRLNDVVLMAFSETAGVLECDITTSMQPFNRLEIHLRFDPSASPATRGGLYDDVAIEIRQ
ncbi:MAG: hypothetical protein WCJ09_17505 [Planctomycetota bacterium]